MREPTRALYAFCRVADDQVDEAPSDPRAAVARLTERLDAVYAGVPEDSPVDRELARMVQRYQIPRALPDALLDGMRWDAEGRTIDDESTLYAYAARVASVVGVVMTRLMGTRDPDVLARACDLGVAMQLTNIARDVGEDAKNGRVYLPRTWLEEVGIDRATWLRDPVYNTHIALLTRRLLTRAEELYARADAGIVALPPDCQRAILAARMIYAAIGQVIARRDHDSVSRRAVVSTPRRLWLLARALFGRRPPARPAVLAEPPLAEARFLVEAS